MDEEKRINGGYEIMESCTIGNNEIGRASCRERV